MLDLASGFQGRKSLLITVQQVSTTPLHEMSRTKVKARGHKRTVKNRSKLSRRVMDPDQVCEMLTPEKMKQIEERKADPFLPGEGKFYCVICDKHFISENAYK